MFSGKNVQLRSINSNSNNAGTSKIEPSFTGDTANAFLTKDLVKRTLPGNIKP